VVAKAGRLDHPRRAHSVDVFWLADPERPSWAAVRIAGPDCARSLRSIALNSDKRTEKNFSAFQRPIQPPCHA
jgi:hypothetical protein